MEKFYERKLNVLLSIVYYHYTKKDLSAFANPFVEIQKEEAGKYREKICIELSKMNISKIASENTLLKQYEDIKTNTNNIFNTKFGSSIL